VQRETALRSIRNLGTAVIVLLGAQIVSTALLIPAYLARISVIDRFLAGDPLTQQEVQRADDFVGGVAGIDAMLFLATAITWLVWQHHGQANLERAGAAGLRFTPGWAVGWWFVPFANFVKGFQSIRELRLASERPSGWVHDRTPPILGWWWAFWLLSAISIGWWNTSTTAASLRTSDRVELYSSVFEIVAAVLAIRIVRAITDSQERLRSAPPPVPPAPGAGSALPPPPPMPGV
jgi:uncharacterized protein DUF4328